VRAADSSSGRFDGPLYVDPNPEHVTSGTPLSSLGAEDQQAARTIAANPTAHWLVGADGVTADVAGVVGDAAAQGAVATFVVYNIPHRDCGYFSANAPQTADQYRQWIQGIVAGLGSHRAILVVEPDALGLAGCLSAADQAERLTLLKYAVEQLSAQGSWTYLDAGNSAWLSVPAAASLLQQAGIDQATGFSLNVSQYRSDAESIQYGNELSAAVGGKHFVLDSSRNGVAPTDTAWCNPPGKGLGHRPTVSTGVPLLDAYLWVKTPGQSDGTCLGGPAAGAWFPSYATMLVRNAAQ
jgi:endoglucanase